LNHGFVGIFRLALAISVLCTHLGLVHAHTDAIFGCTFLDGEVAIETFFTISGFYMALVLHEKYVGVGSYFLFITQRMLRIAPTYLATLVLTVVVLAVLMKIAAPAQMATESLFFWRDHLAGTGFFSALWIWFSNLEILGLSELFYCGYDPQAGSLFPWLPWAAHHPDILGNRFLLNPPAWSVSLELYFYFLAPWLVRFSLWGQLTVIAVSVSFRYAVTHIFHWPYDPFVYRNFFCQLGFFMAGSIGYQFYLRYKEEIEMRSRAWRHGLWLLGFLLLFYRRLPWAHELYWGAVPLMLFLVPVLFSLTRHNSWDRLLGELSYPFYLSHFVALVLAYYLRGHLAKIFIGPFCLVLSLTMAWLLYRYVESWSERFRAHLFHRQRPRAHLGADYFPQEAIEEHGPAAK
jgi:peptidoglycan/LPS O-acetylase OafA/YrhL